MPAISFIKVMELEGADLVGLFAVPVAKIEGDVRRLRRTLIKSDRLGEIGGVGPPRLQRLGDGIVARAESAETGGPVALGLLLADLGTSLIFNGYLPPFEGRFSIVIFAVAVEIFEF